MQQQLRIALLALWMALPMAAQSHGELRLHVEDPQGTAVRAQVVVEGVNRDFRKMVSTDSHGDTVLAALPIGSYRVSVTAPSFAPWTGSFSVRSRVPVQQRIAMSFPTLRSTVDVKAPQVVESTSEASSRVDAETIASWPRSAPGRAIAESVASQPGWLMEANGVLHPRGSEYQVQYLVDGVPLMDNRSAAFLPQDDLPEAEGLTIRTGSYSAELGRKLGGVVEVESKQETRRGWHGDLNLSGASFDTRSAEGDLLYGWRRAVLTVNGQGQGTSRYLDPPTLQNLSNRGTVGDAGTRLDLAVTDRDRVALSLRHEFARFLVPNESLQESAGQRQAREGVETSGILSYQHIFSGDALVDVRWLSRNVQATLASNPLATPIQAAQDRSLREDYFKTAASIHRGRHDLRAGVEIDAVRVHEQFEYKITDPSQFDPETAQSFAFRQSAPDREYAAFVQDSLHLGSWSASVGLRWDDYRLLGHESAVSPRVGVARNLGKGFAFHASYDRVFQTPAVENLLLASSAAIGSISPEVLRLPVRPSHANFYEAGASKTFNGRARLEATYFRRDFKDFADDDVLLNTGISFPIALRTASIYGAEGKLTIARWNRVSGFVSYSYLMGVATLPVTGGLLLGEEASVPQLRGRIPVSQDQRNTIQSRFRMDLSKRVWVASGAMYGSGLPVELEGREVQLITDPRILSQVNLARGRLRPSFAVDLSAGMIAIDREHFKARLQVDAKNVTDRLNVINFAGLFSGTAIAPPRSYGLSLRTSF